MFSLIITLISIALVAALALVTIYYGGSAFKQGGKSAAAGRIVLQSQQVLAATGLFQTANGRWPHDLAELVSSKYLTEVPSASNEPGRWEILTTAYAADMPWVMPVADVPTFRLTGVDEATCSQVNKLSFGIDGIAQQAYSGYGVQCYGTSSTSLAVVISLEAASSLAVALPAAELGAGPAPTLPSDPGWLTPPGATGSASAPSSPASAPPPAESPAAVATESLLITTTGSFTFPDTPVNTPVTRDFVLTNNSGRSVDLNLASAQFAYPASFRAASNDCFTTLAPGATCTLSVIFSPSAAQPYNSSLSVVPVGYTAGTLTGASSPVGLLGTGTPSQLVVLNAPTCWYSSGMWDAHVTCPDNTQFTPANTSGVGAYPSTRWSMPGQRGGAYESYYMVDVGSGTFGLGWDTGNRGTVVMGTDSAPLTNPGFVTAVFGGFGAKIPLESFGTNLVARRTDAGVMTPGYPADGSNGSINIRGGGEPFTLTITGESLPTGTVLQGRCTASGFESTSSQWVDLNATYAYSPAGASTTITANVANLLVRTWPDAPTDSSCSAYLRLKNGAKVAMVPNAQVYTDE